MRIDNKWLFRTEVQRLQGKVVRIVDDFPKDSREDKALIKAYRNGNEEAGRALLESYLDIISVIYNNPSNPPRMRKPNGQKFVTRPPAPNVYDKEDVLQEIIYQFFVLVNEYDEDYGLPFYGLIKGKLFLRFHNNYYREYFNIRSKETEYDEELESYYGRAEESREEEQSSRVPSQYVELYNAMDRLSKRQREIIEMSIVKGWDSTIISQELDMSSSTVRVHLKRGLEKLKSLMITKEEEVA